MKTKNRVSQVVCDIKHPVPADVLDCAADILVEEGWTTGKWGTYCGPKCADGALRAAAIHLSGERIEGNLRVTSTMLLQHTRLTDDGRVLYDEALTAVAREIPSVPTVGLSRANDPENKVIRYNDKQVRKDKRKVIRLFRRTARKLRKG